MKNYRLLIFFLIGLGFITASYAQERLYLGKLGDVAATYRKQAAAAKVQPGNAEVSHSVPSKAPIQLRISNTKKEGAIESFYGEVANTKKTNFFLQISAGVVSGSIIMRDQKRYYRYSSTADGSVFLTEEDIDKVICVSLPEAKGSAIRESALEQAPQLTPEERKRLEAAGAPGDRIGEIPFHESLPGAGAVMYLDFDGQVVSGTLWNSQFNSGNSITAAASTLSDAVMTGVWQIMAEDYRPFGINVTTNVNSFNAAPVNRRMRVIFTATNYFYPGAGGAAYVGSFTWGGTANGETPCFVWNGGIKGAGEAGSHEGGHTLKLIHDGRTSPSEEYFYGQNDWAPIMGVGYNRNQVQWSKGEYANASNTEDDLAKIITNGFGYRADDHGGAISNATPLVRDGVGDVYAVNNKGVISGTFDADVFSFFASGAVNFTVNPDPNYPNLDVYLSILNSSGGLVAFSNPAGTSATITATVAAGTYYLVVDGTAGALGANSQYGSLGAYSISSPITYCLPSYTTGCSSGDLINNFSFNTLVNNASGCTSGSTPGYTNYAPTGTRTTNVKPGNVYALSMQSGSAWAQGFGVWIDYNRDDDFNDAGEFVYASPSASKSDFSTSITIPASASVGMTRMRVRSRYNSTITSTQSCTEFGLGETEDYSIGISPYCVPVYTTGCNSGDYVYNFSFNTLVNNASGCSNGFTKGYTVYFPFGSRTTSVRRESTYQLSVQAGSTWAQGFGVWIDYNKDTDFDDAGEFVYASPSVATTLFTANITIPYNAPLGTTRMRVRSRYNSLVAGSESCSVFGLGEAEDYTINIQTAATQALQVNIYGGTNPYLNPQWNNWNVTSSLSSGTLEYRSGATSPISAVLSQSNGVSDNGTGYGSGMAPAQVLRYTSSSTVARTLTFSGLSASRYYSLELYASRNANSGQSTLFTINGASQSISTYQNLTDEAIYSNLLANSSGQLVVNITDLQVYNYLNGFVLRESINAPTNTAPISNAGPNKALTLPTSSVVLNGTGSDADGSVHKYTWTKISGPESHVIANRTSASATMSNLVEGTYTFRLTVTDNEGATDTDDVQVVVSSSSVTTKFIKVNLYGGTNPYANVEWNNWNVVSSLSSGALKYSDASLSSVGAVLSQSNGVLDNGASYGGTMCPPEVLRYTSSSGVTRTLTLSGLNPSKTYSLELYASRGTSGNSTVFTAGGNSVTIATFNNTANAASFTNLVSNASGQLVVSIAKLNSFNYLNGFILTESAAPPPAIKYVKVNVFGGTNPFTNPEWNNWNVVSSLSSGALKYSDGTSSTAAASLSQSNGVLDNGASYGGTMCPPEVLRYTSSSGVTRTLILSGLNPSKTYGLQLFASRANTGNSTAFSIGATTVTILTDNNKTSVASFSGLVPSAGGQIVVSIAKVNSFNYLNGFILAESAAPAPPVTGIQPSGNTSEGTVAGTAPGARKGALEPVADGLQVRAFPNPSTTHFTFVVQSTERGSVDLRIVDAAGRVVERRQNVAPNTTLTMGRNLKAGSYFLEAVQGNKSKGLKLTRTVQ